MRSVLLTGSTGFIGMNVEPILRNEYSVAAPARSELDLLDAGSVRRYLERGQFDTVVHLATPTAQNPIDKYEELFERSLKAFMSLLHCCNLYGKMIYLGSGAEYGKHRAITKISENEFGRELPQEPYGMSRYIMNELAACHYNITNLRVFGCYGRGDPPYKLMQHIIGCIRGNEPIELRQNTLFDFLSVHDIAPAIVHFIENQAEHKAYNLCSGEPVMIGWIAEEIKRQLGSTAPVVFKQDGFGLDYTGDNSRLRAEIPGWKPRTINEGIKELLENDNWQM